MLPENATYKKVKWSLADEASKKLATINADAGRIYAMGAGTLKVKATAADGSGASATISVEIKSVPLKSMKVMLGDEVMTDGKQVHMEYDTTASLTCSVDPNMYVEYVIEDEQVVSIENGVLKTVGSGSSKVTVTAGGQYRLAFSVHVPYKEGVPRYRALVVSQYSDPNQKGFLPFSENSTSGIVDALKLSDVDGSRYEVTYKYNFTSSASIVSTIKSTFKDAKDNDVSVLYIITHGTAPDGRFVWHLNGTGKQTVYMQPQDVMNALAGIRGEVVLVVLSCYSGGDVENTGNLTNMIRELDNGGGVGSSYSVICASDGTKRASYANTSPYLSYDFFTYALCAGLGWDMLEDEELVTNADTDGDGVISLKEFAKYTKTITFEESQSFKNQYGSSSYWGPPSQRQDVSYYISPNGGNTAIYGL